MKIQDCFKVEPDVIEKAKKQASKERTSKSSIYRKAIVEYLERVEKRTIAGVV